MLDRTSTPTIDADRIAQIAASSPLARVSWSGRGRAPIGYIKGMAVMFAVAQAKLAQGDPAALEMAKAASGDIHAGVRQGTAAWLDVHTVSGRVASSLDATSAPADDDRTVRLHLSTVSGDIDLARV